MAMRRVGTESRSASASVAARTVWMQTGRRIGAALAGGLPGELDALDGHAGRADRLVDGDEPGLPASGTRARRQHEPGNSRVGHRTIMACMGEPASLTQLRGRLAAAVGPVDVVRPLGGTAYLVAAGERRLVAKVGPGCADEADGLRQLGAAPGAPPVPDVVLVEADLIVTTAVDQTARTAAHDEALGRSLALLHRAPHPQWGGGSSWVGACPVDPAPWSGRPRLLRSPPPRPLRPLRPRACGQPRGRTTRGAPSAGRPGPCARRPLVGQRPLRARRPRLAHRPVGARRASRGGSGDARPVRRGAGPAAPRLRRGPTAAGRLGRAPRAVPAGAAPRARRAVRRAATGPRRRPWRGVSPEGQT